MVPLPLATLLLVAGIALQGCVAAVVAVGATAAVVAHDPRSAGTMLDDQTLEVQIHDRIYAAPEVGEESHIKVDVYTGVALLLGETDSEEKREQAGRIASEVPQLDHVVNEIVVKESAGIGGRFNNTWLTTKVKSALVSNNPVPGFDGTRVKVVTADATVYLMGLVTRKEGDAVAEVARNVSGVQRVVKVFNYSEGRNGSRSRPRPAHAGRQQDTCVQGGEHIVEHDSEATVQAAIDLADGPGFENVEQAKQHEAEQYPGPGQWYERHRQPISDHLVPHDSAVVIHAQPRTHPVADQHTQCKQRNERQPVCRSGQGIEHEYPGHRDQCAPGAWRAGNQAGAEAEGQEAIPAGKHLAGCPQANGHHHRFIHDEPPGVSKCTKPGLRGA
jgi:osmotically-inducible protein OsmY